MTVASSRFLLRPMTVADIARVSEIERASFPTMWPQTAYKRELQRNNLAAYLVVCELYPAQDAQSVLDAVAAGRAISTGGEARPFPERSVFARILRGAHGLLKRQPPQPHRPLTQVGERIAGFVGIWFMVDEAHIVTIASAPEDRRRGLGELLLIAAIELAMRRKQEVATLECRVSNTAAQVLYDKYGFKRVGVRKRYYSDNNEDALIMTTFPLASPEYQALFARLRTEHRARHGSPLIEHPEL